MEIVILIAVILILIQNWVAHNNRVTMTKNQQIIVENQKAIVNNQEELRKLIKSLK